MSSEFDFTALLQALADWPKVPIPESTASSQTLERIRQILRAQTAAPNQSLPADFMPLFRQACLEHHLDPKTQPFARLPLASGWPTADQWRESGFEAQALGTYVLVRANLPRVSFLGSQSDIFDDAFFAVQARHSFQVPADPVFERLLKLPTYTTAGQREAVRALIQLPAGETLIANLPTGSGKSVLAQLPPLLGDRSRMTVAIVPTVALAIDQADRMRAILLADDPHAELPPLAFHGGLGEEQRKEVWMAIVEGRQRVLFLSPEHATATLRDVLERAAEQGRISHIVVDEAHLVIGWGSGFRPAFQLLPSLVRSLQRLTPNGAIRLVLASATLTRETIHGLRQLFSVGQPIHLVAGVYLRSEPRYAFAHTVDEEDKWERIHELVQLAPRPLILYVTTPDEAEHFAARLRDVGFTRLEMFTGKTGPLQREGLLNRWKANAIDIMVATSAFGVGVDKGDVRTILHATLPESLDRYYQEVGRSGRDGLASASVLVYTDRDRRQAGRMAVTKIARERTAFDRWQNMISKPDTQGGHTDVYWLNLNSLPVHLRQHSEASLEWNIKTLTLMARAGMLELFALSRTKGVNGIVESETGNGVNFAAVRILKNNLTNEDEFYKMIGHTRSEIHKSGRSGYEAMNAVVTGQLEISEALRQTYSINDPGLWSPVEASCGGCPIHWGDRRRLGAPTRAPVVPRLDHFAPRDVLSQLNLAPTNIVSASRCLIVLPAGPDYLDRLKAMLPFLIEIARPHTLAVPAQVAEQVLRHLFDRNSKVPIDWPFVERWKSVGEVHRENGRHEVCLTVGIDGVDPEVANILWESGSGLNFLVLPDNTPHPVRRDRRLIDTTKHIYADELVRRATTWAS